MHRSALGKGLDALIPDLKVEEETVRDAGKKTIEEVEVERIEPNRYQPRTNFDPEKLKELAASIREKGVVQPVIVRPKDDRYELVAGERRLRAAKEAGLSKIPAIVKEFAESEMLEIALIENIQRQEINPIEEAEAYRQLTSRFGLTQEDMAKKVGKNRSSVSNSLRLLRLPPQIQDWLREGKLSAGHARAILGLESPIQQIETAGKVVKRSLSVREAEALINRTRTNVSRETSGLKRRDPAVEACEEELMEILGTKVRIESGRKKGRIVVEYYSPEDLDRIVNKLLR